MCEPTERELLLTIIERLDAIDQRLMFSSQEEYDSALHDGRLIAESLGVDTRAASVREMQAYHSLTSEEVQRRYLAGMSGIQNTINRT